MLALLADCLLLVVEGGDFAVFDGWFLGDAVGLRWLAWADCGAVALLAGLDSVEVSAFSAEVFGALALECCLEEGCECDEAGDEGEDYLF